MNIEEIKEGVLSAKVCALEKRIDELERRLNYLLGGGLSSYDGGLIATQQQRIAALEESYKDCDERLCTLETWRNVHVQNDIDLALSLGKRESRDEFERKLDEIRRIIEGK
jgi:hypothetical protein